MTRLRLGIVLWSQGAAWPDTLAAGRLVDRLGYDHLWTWDHVMPVFGKLDGPIFEGTTCGRGCGLEGRAMTALVSYAAPGPQLGTRMLLLTPVGAGGEDCG